MPARKTLRIQYYAAFREAAGRGEEELHSTAVTASELYDEVAFRHGFSFDRSILRVVLNDIIVPWTHEVRDGDTVVFLAPFAGG
ncbi:MAG: MoaD/ThiS family protein [Spirochaetia bacterium]